MSALYFLLVLLGYVLLPTPSTSYPISCSFTNFTLVTFVGAQCTEILTSRKTQQTHVLACSSALLLGLLHLRICAAAVSYLLLNLQEEDPFLRVVISWNFQILVRRRMFGLLSANKECKRIHIALSRSVGWSLGRSLWSSCCCYCLFLK